MSDDHTNKKQNTGMSNNKGGNINTNKDREQSPTVDMTDLMLLLEYLNESPTLQTALITIKCLLSLWEYRSDVMKAQTAGVGAAQPPGSVAPSVCASTSNFDTFLSSTCMAKLSKCSILDIDDFRAINSSEERMEHIKGFEAMPLLLPTHYVPGCRLADIESKGSGIYSVYGPVVALVGGICVTAPPLDTSPPTALLKRGTQERILHALLPGPHSSKTADSVPGPAPNVLPKEPTRESSMATKSTVSRFAYFELTVKAVGTQHDVSQVWM